MSRICVLIPVYNREDTIERAINSLKEQTNKNFDVYICNDGCTDKTMEIINKTLGNNPGFKVTIKNLENNMGQNKARNITLKMAKDSGIKYDYVAGLDADDKFMPNHIEDNIKYLDEHQDIDIIYSDCSVGDGTPKWDWVCREFNAPFLKALNYIPHYAVYKAKYLEIPYDENIKRLTDWDRWLNLLLNHNAKFAHLCKVTYHIFRDKNSVSNNNTENLDEAVKKVKGKYKI